MVLGVLISLSPRVPGRAVCAPGVGDQVGSGLAPAAHFVAGLSGSQRGGGACRSEGGERLLAGEHVPDRLGQTAGEVDLRDLAAALTAGTFLELLVALL